MNFREKFLAGLLSLSCASVVVAGTKETLSQPGPDAETMPGPMNQSVNPADAKVGEGDKKPAGPLEMHFGKGADGKTAQNTIARMGTVQLVNRKRIRITDGQGLTMEYHITPQTVVMKHDKKGTLADVKTGDWVTLQYEEATRVAEQITLTQKQ